MRILIIAGRKEGFTSGLFPMPKPKRKDWTNAFKKPCAGRILEIFEYITLAIAVIEGKKAVLMTELSALQRKVLNFFVQIKKSAEVFAGISDGIKC